MCGDSHLPPALESSDLIAIIHPVSQIDVPSRSLPGFLATNSYTPALSASSLSAYLPCPIRGRLRFSNCGPGNTMTEFSHDDSSATSVLGVRVRIHMYGSSLQFGDANPVMHEFEMKEMGVTRESVGLRLDLSVGGFGVIGRTVTIVDWRNKIVGEGIVGRVRG